MKNKKLTLNILSYIFFCFGLFLFSALAWFKKYFFITFEQIIFTLKSPLEGSDVSFLATYIKYFVFYFIIPIFILAFSSLMNKDIYKKLNVYFTLRTKHKEKKLTVKTLLNVCFFIVSTLLFLLVLMQIEQILQIRRYLANRNTKSTIYEELYVNPKDVKISFDENLKKRNLIYIYMESMETTYQDFANGGKNSINYIPNLTKLAQQNTSFINTYNNTIGFTTSANCGFTVASLFATSTGAPMNTPFAGNEMDKLESFIPNIISLGDILKEFGYTNEFLCGSDAKFAGRDKFFKQHGNYKIFDFYSAKEKKYIAPDYYVWWGFEDEILYTIAKDEITELSKQDSPFNFTMLTVDTHHVGGYASKNCPAKYPTTIENVVSFADTMINDFIDWCKTQPWFENTTIVIVGDHPRMDSFLINETPYSDRTNYQCFINAPLKPKTLKHYFQTVDIFPTVLASLGYKIEGERLGFGTNLFSDKSTIYEEVGDTYFNQEVSKHSDFYLKTFF